MTPSFPLSIYYNLCGSLGICHCLLDLKLRLMSVRKGGSVYKYPTNKNSPTHQRPTLFLIANQDRKPNQIKPPPPPYLNQLDHSLRMKSQQPTTIGWAWRTLKFNLLRERESPNDNTWTKRHADRSLTAWDAKASMMAGLVGRSVRRSAPRGCKNPPVQAQSTHSMYDVCV